MAGEKVDFEEKKLAFDRWKAESELELRRLEIEQRKSEGGFWSKFTPTSASVIAALIAAVVALYSTEKQGRNAIALEERKYETTKLLEREKFNSTRELELWKQQHDLIMRAVSVGDEKQAKSNMMALVELGLLQDKELAARVTRLRSPLVLPSATSERPGWTARGSGFRVQNDDDIMNLLLSWEGGFINDSSNPSSAVNAGISLPTLSRFLGREATIDELRGLTNHQTRSIYLKNFFEVDGVRQIRNFVIKGAIINIMVLSGRARAVASVQDALSQTTGRKLSLDGVFGPVTSQLVNDIKDTDFFIETLNCTYWSYIKTLPSFDELGKGWKRRILTFAPGKLQGVCEDLHS